MIRKKCPVCNNNIVFDFVVPTKHFYISEVGEIKREESSIWMENARSHCITQCDSPGLEFYCNLDKDHNIDTQEIIEWMDQVEIEFREKKCLDLIGE